MDCVCQRTTSKVAEKSFAIGTVAETLESMGDAAGGFVDALYPVVMTTLRDADEEVRSNAVYCLGVLSANGGPPALPYPCYCCCCCYWGYHLYHVLLAYHSVLLV